MSADMAETVKLRECPLCHSPHVNLARDLRGIPREAFCKVCGCHAPIAAWNRRPQEGRDEARRVVIDECADAAKAAAGRYLRGDNFVLSGPAGLAAYLVASIRTLKHEAAEDGQGPRSKRGTLKGGD
jgi:hypothetical protein